jgi:hypothetical protein
MNSSISFWLPMQVIFPHPKVAVVTYKATVQATLGGADMSGTYNSGSVWIKEGEKWFVGFHTKTKAQ